MAAYSPSTALLNAISLDADGNPQTESVATFTRYDGTLDMNSTFCDSTMSKGSVAVGLPDQSGQSWTIDHRDLGGCASAYHYYCFGVDLANPL
jgi:hypothetical protein